MTNFVVILIELLHEILVETDEFALFTFTNMESQGCLFFSQMISTLSTFFYSDCSAVSRVFSIFSRIYHSNSLHYRKKVKHQVQYIFVIFERLKGFVCDVYL